MRKRTTHENEGLSFVQKIIKASGHIFTPILSECERTIDGLIEFVTDNEATELLIAVKVFTEESGKSNIKGESIIKVNKEQVDYWYSYTLPVMLVCYSPDRKAATWMPFTGYFKHIKYHNQLPVKEIEAPFLWAFNRKSLNEDIKTEAIKNVERRAMIKHIDHCLDGETEEKLTSLEFLPEHPDTVDSRVIAFLSRRLLFDENAAIAEKATHILGFHVGRHRWSWNSKNIEESALIDYASYLCSDFSDEECKILIERSVDEFFEGPYALGERIADILYCTEGSFEVMKKIAANKEASDDLRSTALFMYYGCNEEMMLREDNLADDPDVGDIYRKMISK